MFCLQAITQESEEFTMNNLEVTFTYVVFMGFMLGIFTYRSAGIIQGWVLRRNQRKIYPTVVTSDEASRCRGPHAWQESILALANLETKSYQICAECGYIAGTESQLNKPGLEVLKSHIKKTQEREALRQTLLFEREKLMSVAMNNLIKRNIQEFHGDFSVNSYALQQFFRKAVIEVDEVNSKIGKMADESKR